MSQKSQPINQVISSMMQNNPLGFAKMMNAGLCNFLQQDCDYPPFCTNTRHPPPTQTGTPTPIYTPTPTAIPNLCTTGMMFPVFGACGQECTPHVAGQGYHPPTHRALDLVPEGAYEVPGSSYLNPDWSTRPGPDQYRTVYAVADGTIYPLGADITDGIALRVNDSWEFVYIHIQPFSSLTFGTFVTAGTPIGVIIPHERASRTVDVSDEDHLHFGLRHPYDITQSVNPASCLRGLIGG